MKYMLLILPSLVALMTPIYNRVDPQLLGIPFFFWFQLVLVPLSALGIYGADRAWRRN